MPKATVMAQLHFGVLPISPDEAGNYSFELDVTDPQGNVGKATVTGPLEPAHHWPAERSGRHPPVLDGRRWNSDSPGTGVWTLPGRLAQCHPHRRHHAVPQLHPRRPGSYTLTEAVSTKTLTMVAGNWRGDDDRLPDILPDLPPQR
jgi:hypothetical protein